MWAPTRGQCALCERRYMRNHLAGVVVMKRIFDLRRKWGMVIHDSKKFYAASAMYAKAQVCLMCQEILLHEDEKCIQASENYHHQLRPQSASNTSSSSSVKSGSAAPETDEVGHMIYNTIVAQWHQLPAQVDECLEDVALNKRARQSSTIFGMDARNAVQPDAIRCTHTKEEFQPWWEVDLANYYVIHSVKIWLREEISHLYNGSGSTSGGGGGSATATSNERPTLRKTTFRSAQQPPLRHLGMFPLHISISMKTGVGRDLDDIIASCVSSHCLEERVMPPIVWHAPPNSRGRFVRIQAEKQAILHIERVHVYIASLTLQQQKMHETRVRKATLRQQMKKAAFRASVVANPAPKAWISLQYKEAVI
uniref:Fucolectin tachylectin-4 pentraxin-1 domain-containing protein n=1 Tax=Globisporangium ultimum (strain ATCC 200006 / CBS 805.95 / DAOM BR144) TaxID=431595 RepID=K3WNX0_GLOUD